jgi:ribonuclease PH
LKLLQELVGGRRMEEAVNSCMIYLIHYKNLCKCHNVTPLITTIKEKKKDQAWINRKKSILNKSTEKWKKNLNE